MGMYISKAREVELMNDDGNENNRRIIDAMWNKVNELG